MSWLTIPHILQLIVGLGLLNVWVLRSQSATSYRGGDSKTLRQEFAEYGLPGFAFWVVGALKVGAGLILVGGVWLDLPVDVAAGIVATLMVGAIAMHVKIGDPIMRSVPAALMLLMSSAIVVL